MDPTCKWECKKDDSGNHTELKNDFCNGASDMFMTGFEAAGVDKRNPCIALFISAWTLDSRLKFIVACFGVALMGFCIEVLISVRRHLSSRKRLSPYLLAPRPSARQWISITLFGINLFLGYLAMLVAMTYSIELFLCVILGLMIGHACFNLKSAVGETVDPCCAPSQNPICAGGGNCSNVGDCLNERTPITRTPCNNIDVEGTVAEVESAPLAQSPTTMLNQYGVPLLEGEQNYLPSNTVISSPNSITTKTCCSKKKAEDSNSSNSVDNIENGCIVKKIL